MTEHAAFGLLAALMLSAATWLTLNWRRLTGEAAPPAPRPARVRPLNSGQAAEDEWTRKLMVVTKGNEGAIARGEARMAERFPHLPRAAHLKALHEEYVRDL